MDDYISQKVKIIIKEPFSISEFDANFSLKPLLFYLYILFYFIVKRFKNPLWNQKITMIKLPQETPKSMISDQNLNKTCS